MTDRLGPPIAFQPPMTPALVVRRASLERNLAAMQGLCDAAGVRLRAHGKMHKCSTLGLRQMELGAVGLCCQTVGEAETYAAAGVADLLVTSPPAPWGPARIAAAARSSGLRLASVADDAGQIERLSAAATAAGVSLGVLIDVDLGQHRTGAPPANVVALARQAAASPGLQFHGVQAYLGHLQHVPDVGARMAANEAGRQRLSGLVDELTEAGLAPAIVTGGGTGTFAADLASGVFTELQAGSYAFMDVEYDACGSPDGGAWPFEPALFLAASVVSANHKTHVTVDVGLKAHSVDGPPAKVIAGAAEKSRWGAMGDEHGAIYHPATLGALRQAGGDPLKFAQAIAEVDEDPAIPWPVGAPKIGDIVWLQPGHCDPTVNLHDAMFVVDEAGGYELWPIDARRTIRA